MVAEEVSLTKNEAISILPSSNPPKPTAVALLTQRRRGNLSDPAAVVFFAPRWGFSEHSERIFEAKCRF
jgi:hypothetical protein